MSRRPPPRTWMLGVALLVGAAFAAGVGLDLTRAPRAEVVRESVGASGWQRIAYEGASVDVPGSWRRVNTGDCEFVYERWGPPDQAACDREPVGVAFYVSAAFDPATGPGVWFTRYPGPGVPAWGGYEYAGDFVVWATSDDRDEVAAILSSVRGADLDS